LSSFSTSLSRAISANRARTHGASATRAPSSRASVTHRTISSTRRAARECGTRVIRSIASCVLM
jgi:hypothetical protein